MSSTFNTDSPSPPSIPSKSRLRRSIIVPSEEKSNKDLKEFFDSDLKPAQLDSSSSVFTRSDLEVSDVFSGNTYSEMSSNSKNAFLEEGLQSIDGPVKTNEFEQSSDEDIDLTEESSLDLQNSLSALNGNLTNLPSPVKVNGFKSRLDSKAKSSESKSQKNSFQDVRKKFMESREEVGEINSAKNSPSPLFKNRLSLNTDEKVKAGPKSPLSPQKDIKPLNKSRFSFSEKDKENASGPKDFLKKDALGKRTSLSNNLANSPFAADLKGSLKKVNGDSKEKLNVLKLKNDFPVSPIKDKFSDIKQEDKADLAEVNLPAKESLGGLSKESFHKDLPLMKSISHSFENSVQETLTMDEPIPIVESATSQSLEKNITIESEPTNFEDVLENTKKEVVSNDSTLETSVKEQPLTMPGFVESGLLDPEAKDIESNSKVIKDSDSVGISEISQDHLADVQGEVSNESHLSPIPKEKAALVDQSQAVVIDKDDIEQSLETQGTSKDLLYETEESIKENLGSRDLENTKLEVKAEKLSSEGDAKVVLEEMTETPIKTPPQIVDSFTEENVAVFEESDNESFDEPNAQFEEAPVSLNGQVFDSQSNEPILQTPVNKFGQGEHPTKTSDQVGSVISSPEPISKLDLSDLEKGGSTKSTENPEPNLKHTEHTFKHTARNTSTVSYSSQTSQDSQRSDNGILNKVRNLYGMFQFRPENTTAPQNGTSDLGQSTNYNIPRRLSDSPNSPPLNLRGKSHLPSRSLPNEANEDGAEGDRKTTDSPPHSIHLQSIPKHMRRISLLDVTPPSESRAASLYSVEDLDADNVDWDFWGQLINNFESMMKSQRTLVQRNIREGIPVSMRGMVWQLLSNIRATNLLDTYTTLLTKTSPYEKKIIQDLPRTFPNLAYFKSKDGSGQESLFNVLKCYSIYDPHVGYCQGLSFLAGPLLLNMPDEEAFCVLVKMMEGLRQHYTPAMEGLQVRTYQFERLMEEKLPEVYKHLQAQGIQSTMYVSQWFLTLFAYRSSMKMVFRVLDLLLLEGGDIMVKVALALLIENQEEILVLEFDELIAYLKSGIFDNYQNRIDKLMAIAVELKLSEKRMAKWSREYLNELAARAEEEAYAASLQGVNQQLMASNKDLAAQVDALAASGRDFSTQLAQAHSQILALEAAKAKLEMQVNELEVRLHTERQRAESDLREEMELLAQKNLSLVNKNATLEDALSQAEDSLISLRSKYSS